MSSEITAEKIEDVFGKHSDSVRFANFCNAVVMAEGSASVTTIPILSEKPGADGGIDGEWTIPADVSSDFKSLFGLPGWNVFQYKARSITGEGRQRAFSNLCNNVKGALAKLLNRLSQPKHCCQYALFTNLQLGVETITQTPDGALLQKQRTQLAEAIAEGSNGKTPIKIFDAAQLAGFVNAHPALRLTYFSVRWTPSFRPLSAENKMDSRGLLSSLLLFVGRSLCALKPFGKERTSRAWHCPSSLSVLIGFQYLPPQAV